MQPKQASLTYKVRSIHDAILNGVGAVQGEFQDLLLLLATFDSLLFKFLYSVIKENSVRNTGSH